MERMKPIDNEENPFDVMSKYMSELEPESMDELVELAYIVASLVSHRAKQFSQLSVNENEKMREKLTRRFIDHQTDRKNLGLIAGPGLVQMLPQLAKMLSATSGPMASLGAAGIARVLSNLNSKMLQQGLAVGGQALGGAMQFGNQFHQAEAQEISTRLNSTVNRTSDFTSEKQEKGGKESQAIQGLSQFQQQRSRALEAMFR